MNGQNHQTGRLGLRRWALIVTLTAKAFSEAGCGSSSGAAPPGAKVTYEFTGYMNTEFGSIAPGTPFSGSFSYIAGQMNLSSRPDEGKFVGEAFFFSIGKETFSSQGSCCNIYLYDNGSYARDAFAMAPRAVSGTLGGRKLDSATGISLMLRDMAGKVWDQNSVLPGERLTLSDFSTGNANYVQLTQEVVDPRHPYFDTGPLVTLTGRIDP